MTSTDQHTTLTVEEAAAILRIGRSAAYAAARSGDLPTIRVGRTLRVPRARLDALLGVVPTNADGAADDGAAARTSAEAGRRDAAAA